MRISRSDQFKVLLSDTGFENPYFLGYQGVVEAAMSTQGGIPPAILDPGVTIADKDNMNNPEVKSLLEPPTAKVGG